MNITVIKDLGRCCNCSNKAVLHLPLPFYAPKLYDYAVSGWECIFCEIEAVGAYAVLCEDCADIFMRNFDYANPYKAIKNVVVGMPDMNMRMTMSNFLINARPLIHNINHHAINVYKALYYNIGKN